MKRFEKSPIVLVNNDKKQVLSLYKATITVKKIRTAFLRQYFN
ncbi:hypothetical protein [Mesomycoplasma ovipneumoniae]|nr:hypothetical protein [Mesomycoplasma ovipneumoniae]